MHGYNENLVTKLVESYRAGTVILHSSNQLFYEGDLLAKGSDQVN